MRVVVGVRGGVLLSPKLYVDVSVKPQKSDFLYTKFLPNYPPISTPFSKEISTQLHQFLIWAPLSLINPSPDGYNKFCKKVLQKGGHSIPSQCGNPPNRGIYCTILNKHIYTNVSSPKKAIHAWEENAS